jgi:hypothetical protein
VSSPPAGPRNATIDHYRAQVPVEPGAHAAVVFERFRNRLFAYDIFPPSLVQHAIAPPGSVSEGATIVQRVTLGPLALEIAVRAVSR